MRRFLFGVGIGLLLGWLTVPIVKATYDVDPSDHTAKWRMVNEDDDLRKPQAYKWYLTQMLMHIISVDEKLTDLNKTMNAIKDKLHA